MIGNGVLSTKVLRWGLKLYKLLHFIFHDIEINWKGLWSLRPHLNEGEEDQPLAPVLKVDIAQDRSSDSGKDYYIDGQSNQLI